MGTGSFPGAKCGRGVLLTTHPLLVPRSSAFGPHRVCNGITLPFVSASVCYIRCCLTLETCRRTCPLAESVCGRHTMWMLRLCSQNSTACKPFWEPWLTVT